MTQRFDKLPLQATRNRAQLYSVPGSARLSGTCRSSVVAEKVTYNKREVVKLGGMEVSPMGLGTWAWGNKFLW